MPHVTLVSDLEPDVDWSAFQQLVSLSQLLTQSGHSLSLWVSPKARELEIWPQRAEKLAPCPNWSTFDAMKSLPFWMGKKTDILHFVPKMNSKNRLHAFTWLAPFFKSFHNPLIVSSFFSWPAAAPYYLKQLLHLSELVLTPSEYLRHMISSDSHSTAFQTLSTLPLFPHITSQTDSNIPSYYQRLVPFLYLPGGADEWEDPVASLEMVLDNTQDFNGWIVAGHDWTQNFLNSRKLQQLLKQRTDAHRVFFPETMTSELHEWLIKNCTALWLKGMRLSSLSLSQSFEDGLDFERPLLFSKLQSDLHSPHWASLFTDPPDIGAWLNDPNETENVVQKVRELKTASLLPDPANQLNRLYSQSLQKKVDD